jgi:peptidoglycan/xylan/chitin deacetylase (PgdA/CDA1 family)
LGLVVACLGAATLLMLSRAAPALAGGSGSDAAFAVERAGLQQEGQDLVWRVTLDHQFTATQLKRSGRSLCLVLQPARVATRRVCLTAGPHRAVVQSWLRGRARTIAASVSRPAGDLAALVVRFAPPAVGLAYRPLGWQVLSTQGTDQVLFPAAPATTRLHVPRLVGCAPRGRSLVYAGATRQREVALTFDDGPWGQPPTIDFLKVLERMHAPATFFEIGDQLGHFDPSGALERRMLADGDLIGDHTWSHPIMTSLSARAQRSQIASTVQAIRKRTGFTTCLWRPPYGAVDSGLVRLARAQGLLTINWDVDPRDWATPGTGAIVSNVLTNAHSGSIVIQHFGGGPRYQTLAALPQEIRGLRARGYRLVTVAQLLGLRLIYK